MSLFAKFERVDTTEGILAVANFVNERPSRPSSFQSPGAYVDGYDVYLPSYLDQTSAFYAEWLSKHPHARVRLHYYVREKEDGSVLLQRE
jgi:hypothetical protein